MVTPIEMVRKLQKTQLEKAAIDVLIAKFKLRKPEKLFTETEMLLMHGVYINDALNMLLSLHFITPAKARKIVGQLVDCGVCRLETVKGQNHAVLYLIPLAGSGLAIGGDYE